MNNLIQYILNAVSVATGVAVSDITSKSRKEEVVLARKLFVKFAKKMGVTTDTLAKTLNITAAGVRNIYNATNTQENGKIFIIYSKEIKKEVETKYAIPVKVNA